MFRVTEKMGGLRTCELKTFQDGGTTALTVVYRVWGTQFIEVGWGEILEERLFPFPTMYKLP